MGESQTYGNTKQRITLSNGTKCIADSEVQINSELKATLAQVVSALEQSTQQKVYAVYYNADKNKQGKAHSVNVKFDTLSDE